MANTATVQIRMDAELKKQAEKMFNEMGMNMTTAFTIFTKAVVNQGRIPFEIYAAEVPNAKTRKVLDDVKNGKNVVGPFKNTKKMMDYLNA
jgi:DNA-damage-inducible protein J